MKVVDLKALKKERGLRGYSKLKKAELITFLQNNLQSTPALRTRPPKPTRPPPPPPQMSTWEPIDDRPRQNVMPGFRDMDIFGQQEMPKNRSQVTSKRNDWYDWLVNHVPKTIKDEANRAFEAFKDKVMGLYNNLISKRNSIKKKIKELKGSHESFNPIELEQAFNRAYRSYRINGRSRMDIDTFFDQIRQNLIDLMNRELTDLCSARVPMTAWIRFIQALEDDFGNIIGSDRVEKAFNSRMTEIHLGSDLDEIIDTHMKTQIKNSALTNSIFMFNEVLFIDLNFHRLDLTRGSSYIPLPSWIASKKAVINPKNENDEECFKWAVSAALHHKEIKSHPKHISNIMRYTNNYNWSGLEFPVAIDKINEFEKNNNDIGAYILGIKEKRIYICRKSKYYNRKNIVILLLIDNGE